MYWLNGMPKCRLGYSKAGTLRQKNLFNFICPIKFLFLNLSSQSRWHMIALLFLFQKRYHDLKCCTNWLSDKQNRGVTPHCSVEFSHFLRVVVLTQPPFSHTEKMINFMCPIKFLFLNLSSQSRWHMKAPLFLFQKRYHDPKCCTNWLSDKQKRGVTFPIFPLSSECSGLAVP